MIEEAQRRSGLSDFGDTPFLRPMQLLLQACREEAELSLFGAAAIRWDTVRFLTNLLRLRDEEKRCPEILDQSIEPPLIIAGLPRSGTTFLHSLLIEDRANIVPRVWQLIYPYPTRRDQRGGSADRRQQRVARQLRMFQILAPQFHRLHPIEASSPQECSEITAHIFASLRFDTTYRIPSYRRWLDGAGHLDAYRFHKRFLQHLQYQRSEAGRWVLKCPDHIFALGALREVYPDANLVFVHRDPVAVLASVARLTEVLRRPFSRRVDRFDVGRADSDRWLAAAGLMIAAADQERFRTTHLPCSLPGTGIRSGWHGRRTLSTFRPRSRWGDSGAHSPTGRGKSHWWVWAAPSATGGLWARSRPGTRTICALYGTVRHHSGAGANSLLTWPIRARQAVE